MIRVKRIYDPASQEDGLRYLVDRLWPRGVSRSEAALDDWLKELSPSDELRRWFDHEPDKWGEFRHRYRAELQSTKSAQLLDRIAREARTQTVTLLYGARDEEYNQAVALRDFIESKMA